MNTQSRARPDRIVSVHFPKAAGSSLKEQFAGFFGDQLYLDYARGPLAVEDCAAIDFPPGKAIVHGHFPATRYAATSAYMFTFLREPVENLISIYYFWGAFERPTNTLHARFLQERPSLIAFARYPKIRRLMSETYFGDFDLDRLDFVGFHDTRNVDLPRLAERLHLPLDPSLHLNPTVPSPDRADVTQNQAIICELEHLLSDDISFYLTVKRRFSAA